MQYSIRLVLILRIPVCDKIKFLLNKEPIFVYFQGFLCALKFVCITWQRSKFFIFISYLIRSRCQLSLVFLLRALYMYENEF